MKSSSWNRFLLSVLAGALFGLLASGCANLSAIRSFADISAESAQYTALVDDYANAPTRLKRYEPAERHADLDRRVAERKQQQEQLLLRQALVESYMSALGQLAADEAVVYDKEFDALGKAASSGKFLDKSEADAFATIAKVLTTAATDIWRKGQLRKLIADSNASFAIAVGGLHKVVQEGFVGELEAEEAAINKYYTTLSKESQDKAGIAALNEWREWRLGEIARRKEAGRAYADLLSRIAAAHQKLYEGRDHLSAKTLLAEMKQYANELKKLFNAVKALA